MDLVTGFLLAAVQGLTEFLPVSSSGHLRLFGDWFGLQDPQTLFDAVLHGGTLGAVLVVYRDTLGRMFRAVCNAFARRPAEESTSAEERAYVRLFWFVGLGTVPTGLIGVPLGTWTEERFASPIAVGVLLLINGVILLTTRPRGDEDPAGGRRGLAELTAADALLIGAAQGLAVFRGISRSGTTIAAGMALGLRRDIAAQFSFLLSIPAIGGALAILLLKAEAESLDWVAMAVGAAVSFGVGLWALRWLLRLVSSNSFYRFAPYCWALGLVAIGWGWVNQ